MPESYGKRQRSQIKAKKATAREERRLARNQRRADREAGLLPPGPGEGPPNDSVATIPPEPTSDADDAADEERSDSESS